MRLLDADILIDVSRYHPPALQWLMSLPDRPYVSGIALMELIAGCMNRAEVFRVKALAAPYPSLWPTPSVVSLLWICLQYRLSHGLGLIDSLIAATAIGQSATLCTFNVKHFAAVPELTTEQPYARA